jgi:hypothetical protein
MTTLLERPTVLAVGKPPLQQEIDAPAPPGESGEANEEEE